MYQATARGWQAAIGRKAKEETEEKEMSCSSLPYHTFVDKVSLL